MLVGRLEQLDSFVRQERSLAKGLTPEGINAMDWPPKEWKMGTPIPENKIETAALLAERHTTHGHIEDNAYFTESLMAVIEAPRPKAGSSIWKLMPSTCRLCLGMIAHKIGRILSGNWREPDHWRDIAGYATLVADRLERGELQ